jgi:hypothetical protein
MCGLDNQKKRHTWKERKNIKKSDINGKWQNGMLLSNFLIKNASLSSKVFPPNPTQRI